MRITRLGEWLDAQAVPLSGLPGVGPAGLGHKSWFASRSSTCRCLSAPRPATACTHFGARLPAVFCCEERGKSIDVVLVVYVGSSHNATDIDEHPAYSSQSIPRADRTADFVHCRLRHRAACCCVMLLILSGRSWRARACRGVDPAGLHDRNCLVHLHLLRDLQLGLDTALRQVG
jgi:hypothetical protein